MTSYDFRCASLLKATSLRDGGTQVLYIQHGDIIYSLRLMNSFSDKGTPNFGKIRIQYNSAHRIVDEILEPSDLSGMEELLDAFVEDIPGNIYKQWMKTFRSQKSL